MIFSDTSQSPVDAIRNALLNITGSQRTGTQLRALIDTVCPGLDLRAAAGVPAGPGALTKFLYTHFADILHAVGKSGGDSIYSVGAPGAGANSVTRSNGGGRATNLWAVFASPGLRQQLVFDRETGRSFAHPRGAPITDNQIAIAPVTDDEFRVMAEKFAETAPPNVKQELQEILNQPDFVYQNWISVLRSKYPSHHHRWGLYRVQAIIDLFRHRLAEAGVPQDLLEPTVERLIEAQSAAYNERLLSRTRSALYAGSATGERQEARTPPQVVTLPVAERSTSIDPRSLAILAIKNMSATEIRQLAIPLGAIIDAGWLASK
jgi:hypothetical protein